MVFTLSPSLFPQSDSVFTQKGIIFSSSVNSIAVSFSTNSTFEISVPKSMYCTCDMSCNGEGNIANAVVWSDTAIPTHFFPADDSRNSRILIAPFLSKSYSFNICITFSDTGGRIFSHLKYFYMHKNSNNNNNNPPSPFWK
eukprot:m.69254 g.69254  ORF g.69254 m.69254 type:complete len:141 (-) comp8267_c0_seq14:580-1002(-)